MLVVDPAKLEQNIIMDVGVISSPQSMLLGSTTLHLLLTITGILVLYHFWFQSLRYVKLGNKIPGLDPLPFVGNAHTVMNKKPKELIKFAFDLLREKGKVIRFWFGSRLVVGLTDPLDVELILGNTTHLKKSADYQFFAPWLGDGLLISSGEKWKSHRKIIAPTFHQSILKTFIPVFNKNAKELVAKLKKDEVGRIFDIHDYMSGTTVDVLIETVMGVVKGHDEKTSFKYAKAVMDMCEIIHFRHFKIWLRPDFIFNRTTMAKMQKSLINIIHSLTNKVIDTKKNNYFNRIQKGENTSLYSKAVEESEQEEKLEKVQAFTFGSALRDDLDEDDDNVGEKRRLAFLDYMIEASQTKGTKLSDVDIKDQVNTIMFEGHDTTAAASSFFICMLGVHPEIQQRVQQEMNDIFHGSDRPVTFNDTLEMKYLERVLLETMRMYPPVPLITRELSEDLNLVSGNYVVPKGTTVLIGQLAIHRDADYFPNPLKFDPDNFLPERCQARPYYSFIPFSAGPRSCVGRKYAMMKLKVLLATLIRNFNFKSMVEEKDFELQADIILKRADGFRIRLEERTL